MYAHTRSCERTHLNRHLHTYVRMETKARGLADRRPSIYTHVYVHIAPPTYVCTRQHAKGSLIEDERTAMLRRQPQVVTSHSKRLRQHDLEVVVAHPRVPHMGGRAGAGDEAASCRMSPRNSERRRLNDKATYICTCTHTNTPFAHLHVPVYTHTHTCIHIHINTHTHTYTHKHTDTRIHMPTCTHKHANKHANKRKTNKNIRAHMHARGSTHTNTLTHTHTRACVHSHNHMYPHAYMHMIAPTVHMYRQE